MLRTTTHDALIKIIEVAVPARDSTFSRASLQQNWCCNVRPSSNNDRANPYKLLSRTDLRSTPTTTDSRSTNGYQRNCQVTTWNFLAK